MEIVSPVLSSNQGVKYKSRKLHTQLHEIICLPITPDNQQLCHCCDSQSQTKGEKYNSRQHTFFLYYIFIAFVSLYTRAVS